MSLALIAGLAACSGGNIFDENAGTGTGTGTGGTDTGSETETEGTGINRDGIPPGSNSPTPDAGLFRSEPRSTATEGSDSGNGYAEGVSYNSERDEFTVDNIAFDGDSPYTRVPADINGDGELDPIRDLNGQFAVYEAPLEAIDPVTGGIISQIEYRAVYGVSKNRTRDANGNVTGAPTTEFAIIRSGGYSDYGFGGFIYQRNTGVSLPNRLQATYTGKSGGLRDFNGTGGLQYTTADVVIDVDFDDFNDSADVRGDGVKGLITNRRVFNLNGQQVSAAGTNEGPLGLPTVTFVISPDVLDNNGEILTDIRSDTEKGTFYAVMSGDNPNEIVGVYVLENDEGTERDTSGFIVYRGPTDTQ